MQNSSPTILSGDLMAVLASKGDVKVYSRNKILIVEGEKSNALYILVTGQLKVFTRDSLGREVVYNTLQPGELFGEMFLNGGARSALVKATTESQCILIDDTLTRDLIRAYPEFAECLIQSVIARLRDATHMIKGPTLKVLPAFISAGDAGHASNGTIPNWQPER